MHRRHAWLSRLQEAFSLLPAVAIAIGLVLGLVLPQLDTHLTLPDAVSFSGEGDTARTVLTVVASLGVSVAGVSFSVIVVALVLASQQLSPRVLRSFQRQRINQAVLALLLGTSTYALFVLSSVSDDKDEPAPELSITLAMLLAAASLLLFVMFLHHAVRSLNASAVIRRIAADGHEAVNCPFPAQVGQEPDDPAAAEDAAARWADLPELQVRAPRAGYVASIDGDAIVRWAKRHDVFVEQSRPVGAFAVTGGLLAAVRGEAALDLDVEEVARLFMLSEERVVDGDVAFPIRQLTDIALKGLSPGINDPTTAENAMDSVTDTLVRFACAQGPAPLRLDSDGDPRFRAIVPTLDDLVRLAFDQVRRDSASRPSFAVRLLELLTELRDVAPASVRSEEIDRQAQLIAEQAADLADLQADQRLVGEAYRHFAAARADVRRGV